MVEHFVFPINQQRLLRVLAVLAVVSLNVGCALDERLRQVDQQVEESSALQDRYHRQFERQMRLEHDNQLVQHVDRPWIVGEAVPLAEHVILPKALQKKVNTSLVFADQGLSLEQVAQRITLATRIPVRIQPEALLPPAAFLPQHFDGALGAATQGEQTTPLIYLQGPAEPLAHTLDRISAQLDVYWRYENQQIEFYKTVTRFFKLPTLGLETQTHAQLGKQENTSDHGFHSASGTEVRGQNMDILFGMKEKLQAFMTRAGRIEVLADGSGTIVVKDLPHIVEQMAQFIQAESKLLKQRVRLVFEELTVSLQGDAERNVDWDIVFQRAAMAAGFSTAGSNTPGQSEASLGIAKGDFSGTEALLQSLAKHTKVVRRNTVPVLTLNKRPVTHALRTTFTYIDKVETTPQFLGGGYEGSAVSLSQREETVGTLLTVVPDVQEDGLVLLSIAYDNTVAQPLETVSVGSAQQNMQIQQIAIDGAGMVQQVLLRPGQPLLISGFDREQQEAAQRRLNPDAPLLLGGGDRYGSERVRTFVIMTVQVEEGR